MKFWIDDIKPAPEGYVWCRSVNSAITAIELNETAFSITEREECKTEIISMDHDAGKYRKSGGNYIQLLYWLEETGRNYPIHIHSMNPVSIERMRRIIERNNWEEV